MSDQGWNTPGTPPPDPNAGAGWNQAPPPSPPQQPWDQTPPPPSGDQWGQQPAAPQGGQQWGQPPAQQAPGQQPWGAPPPGQQPGQQWGQPPGQAGGGIDPKIAGILAYLFGWLGGLVVYLVNKDNFSRFHGAQSILLSISVFAVFFVFSIVSFLLGFIGDFLGFIFIFLWPLLGLGVFALSIYLMVSAYQGKKVVLPVIGPMAEQWAGK